MKARRDGRCPRCGFSFPKGTEIGPLPRPLYGWGHVTCPSSKDEAQQMADDALCNKSPEDAETCRVSDGKFSVSFSYDPDTVAAVKALPQRRFEKQNGARWWVLGELFGDLVRNLQDADTGIGRVLGHKASLTPEEAALGRLMIPTYVRQIGDLPAFKVALGVKTEES